MASRVEMKKKKISARTRWKCLQIKNESDKMWTEQKVILMDILFESQINHHQRDSFPGQHKIPHGSADSLLCIWLADLIPGVLFKPPPPPDSSHLHPCSSFIRCFWLNQCFLPVSVLRFRTRLFAAPLPALLFHVGLWKVQEIIFTPMETQHL